MQKQAHDASLEACHTCEYVNFSGFKAGTVRLGMLLQKAMIHEHPDTAIFEEDEISRAIAPTQRRSLMALWTASRS